MRDSVAPPIRLVIVGHVDHGKSTLIGRLLHDTGSVPEGILERVREAGRDGILDFAFITDHLAEERRDEKTIDTTQAFFEAGGRHYVIIDTPGHAEFLKNMFTGASRADAALLVVDAVEGVRKQTLAHCNVLALLGVRWVMPMVNKMDKAGYSRERFEEVASSVGERLRELGIEPQRAIPVSAVKGDNIMGPSERMAWYSGPALVVALSAIPDRARPTDRPMRFAVQGALEVDGRRLFLGRVEAGTLRSAAAVRILPSGSENRIASVEVFGPVREAAEAGESIAVTLAAPVEGSRGLIVCDAADEPEVSSGLRGRVFWLSEQPLQVGETVEVRIATQDVAARVESIGQSFHASAPEEMKREAAALAYGEIGEVRLAAVGPLVREPFSRDNALGLFVLARQGNVAGAGTVCEESGQ